MSIKRLSDYPYEFLAMPGEITRTEDFVKALQEIIERLENLEEKVERLYDYTGYGL